jgi:hypothetical protein
VKVVGSSSERLWRTLPLWSDEVFRHRDVLALAAAPSALLQVEIPAHRDERGFAIQSLWAEEVQRLRELLPPGSLPLGIFPYSINALIPEANEEKLLVLLERTRALAGASTALIMDTDLRDALKQLYAIVHRKPAPWRVGLPLVTRASDWGPSLCWPSTRGLARLNSSWFESIPVPMLAVRLTGRYDEYRSNRGLQRLAHALVAHFREIVYPTGVVPFEIDPDRVGFLFPHGTADDALRFAERLRAAVAASNWEVRDRDDRYVYFRCEPGEITALCELHQLTSAEGAGLPGW